MGNMILAAHTVAAAKSSSGSLNFILIIVVLFGVLYFVMIRPQRNRQRKAAEQQNQVQPGQRVRTTSGMYGTVVGVAGDDVILEVAPGVELRFVKRAIMQVLTDEEAAPAEPAYEDGDEAADGEVSDYQPDEHESFGHEADEPAFGHEADEPAAQAGDGTAPHAGGTSPNGTHAAADETRPQGTL